MMLQQVPTPAPPAPPDVVVLGGGGGGPDLFEAIAIVAVSVSMAWVTYKLLMPLIKAFASRIEGKGNSALEHRVQELEQRVHEGEQAQQRVAELEERLDFAERLLSQREEPLRLKSDGERR